jgi:hypothetical protein
MSTSYNTEDEQLTELRRNLQIRALNDAFRTEPLSVGSAFARNSLVITRGVADYGNNFIDRAVAAVQTFSNFNEHNDPHGEHDFGAFEIDGVALFWKLDCYDRWSQWGSPDAADPAVTRRVLTILLADEY